MISAAPPCRAMRRASKRNRPVVAPFQDRADRQHPLGACPSIGSGAATKAEPVVGEADHAQRASRRDP